MCSEIILGLGVTVGSVENHRHEQDDVGIKGMRIAKKVIGLCQLCHFLFLCDANKKTSNRKLTFTKSGQLQMAEGKPQRGKVLSFTVLKIKRKINI